MDIVKVISFSQHGIKMSCADLQGLIVKKWKYSFFKTFFLFYFNKMRLKLFKFVPFLSARDKKSALLAVCNQDDVTFTGLISPSFS